ncbi:phage tail tape measure protein [Acuticoccus sp. MNP-M23]|uniref:phage tail tape measure protein n=1 Tax=Acuticoccus sp. MNP-M23 TaxID=3072793 RepID=UPI0028157518|nr:phage tail tape measure protein [Acuticoccus sp. MNP-M23]WMS42288.1 phage tail tape measure protein [Acuticoccus sp. MNP-M23]
MATLNSKLVLTLVDKVSARARTVSGNLDRLRGQMARNQAAMAGMRSSMFEAAGVGYALYRGLKAPISVAGSFEASMNRLQANLSSTTSDMAVMSKMGRQLGRDTQFSATEAANAMEMLAKNGLNFAQITGGATAASLNLAAATGSTLSDAADLATDVMANFNKTAGEMPGVADQLVGATIRSKFSFNDFVLAVGQAGGVAGQVGVELEDFVATIAATSSAFKSGSDAGTSYKTFLSRLNPESKEAAEMMEQYGLSFFNASGEMKSMEEIAQSLQDGLGDLSEEAKIDATKTIFGIDAMRTALAMSKLGAEGIREMKSEIGDVSAEEIAAARMKGWEGAVKRFRSAMEDVGISLGNTLLPGLTALLQNLLPVLNAISLWIERNPELTATIVTLTSALIALKVASVAARWSFLWMRGAGLTAAIGGMASMTAASRALSFALLPLGSAARGAKRAMMGFAAAAAIGGLPSAAKIAGVSAAFRVLRGAIVAVRLALIASGIGAAIVALAVAGTWVYTNWSGIKEMFRGIAEGIKTSFPAATAVIDGLGNAVNKVSGWIGDVSEALSGTDEEFRALGEAIGETIGGKLQSAADTVRGAFQGALNIVNKIKAAISSLTSSIANISWPEAPVWVKDLFGSEGETYGPPLPDRVPSMPLPPPPTPTI